MDRRAHWIVEEQHDTFIVIRDVGPWDRHLTVTNDAEGVVDQLLRSGTLRNGKRLFCYDSSGEFDELLVIGGRFAGFLPGVRP